MPIPRTPWRWLVTLREDMHPGDFSLSAFASDLFAVVTDDRPRESAADGLPPLFDQVHGVLHLWRAGDVTRVDDYLEERGLRRNALFRQVLQALIELAGEGGEERALLESLSNHVGGTGGRVAQPRLLEA